MAQNLDRIMGVLRAHPDGMCDDCLSQISSVTPRQTVYAICSVQSRKGVISRAKGVCPQDRCHRTKLVNALPANLSGDRVESVPPKNSLRTVPPRGSELTEQTN